MQSAGDHSVFFGRIHPERANVQIQGLPDLHLNFPDEAVVDASFQVTLSEVTVRVAGKLHPDPATERNAIAAMAQLLVDVLGFTSACGYTVEIVGCNRPDGTTIFGCDIPALAPEPPMAPADFDGITTLLLRDKAGRLFPLRRALADFRRAILEPDDTPFHCFRAVEALMYYFGRNARVGRRSLCSSLRIDDKWLLRELEKPAAEIRHGKLVNVSDDDRLQALRAARSIIARFVFLIANELKELPSSDYPTLE